MNEAQDSFQRFMFDRRNKRVTLRRKEANIKLNAALEVALKKEMSLRPTEKQLALMDELAACGQRRGVSITRELILFAMRPAKPKEQQ